MAKYHSALSDLIHLLTFVLEEHRSDETPHNLTDIGSVIGISIAKHLNSKEEGWVITDLYHGITQGVATQKKSVDTIVKGEHKSRNKGDF